MNYYIYDTDKNQADFSAVALGDGTIMTLNGDKLDKDITNHAVICYDTGYRDAEIDETINSMDTVFKVVPPDSEEFRYNAVDLYDNHFSVSEPFVIGTSYTGDAKLKLGCKFGGMPLLTKVANKGED